MRIAWAIPCRYVEVTEGLATMVGAGANIYAVPGLPAPLAVSVCAQITGAEDELEHEHHLRGQILGPNMQPTGEPLDVPGLQFPPAPNKPPGWEGTIIIPVVMQWLVEEFGTYTLDFSIDDRSTTVPILIAEVPQPPAT